MRGICERVIGSHKLGPGVNGKEKGHVKVSNCYSVDCPLSEVQLLKSPSETFDPLAKILVFGGISP